MTRLTLSVLQERLRDAVRREQGLRQRIVVLTNEREMTEANVRTAQNRVLGHRGEIERLEGVVEERDARVAALEAEVDDLKAHPVVITRHDRERLPHTRYGWNWHMRIGDKDGGLSPHVHVNLFPDGHLGELFIELDDGERHMIGGGWADAAATFFSICLQRGSPVREVAEKLKGLRGGPGGAVWYRPDMPEELNYAQECARSRNYIPDPDVSRCTSLLDAIGKKLLVRFCGDKPFGPRAPEGEAATETATRGE